MTSTQPAETLPLATRALLGEFVHTSPGEPDVIVTAPQVNPRAPLCVHYLWRGHLMDGQREPLKPPDDDDQTSSAQAPEADSGGSRRMLLLSIAVFLCVIAAGVSAAVLSSPGGGQAGYITGPGPNGSQSGQVAGTGGPAETKTRTTQPMATKTRSAQPTASHASNRATTGADVTSKGVAKSALQWPPQLERQMLRWWAGPAGNALTTVETQMGNAMQAAGLKLYATMRLACMSLASGIGAADDGPPIPYGTMRQLYAKALAGLSRAAVDCRTAISERAGSESVDIHLNQGLLSLSRAEFAAMSKKLYRATAEIQALGR